MLCFIIFVVKRTIPSLNKSKLYFFLIIYGKIENRNITQDYSHTAVKLSPR